MGFARQGFDEQPRASVSRKTDERCSKPPQAVRRIVRVHPIPSDSGWPSAEKKEGGESPKRGTSCLAA